MCPGKTSKVIWTTHVLSALAFLLRKPQRLFNSFLQAKFLLTLGELIYYFSISLSSSWHSHTTLRVTM